MDKTHAHTFNGEHALYVVSFNNWKINWLETIRRLIGGCS